MMRSAWLLVAVLSALVSCKGQGGPAAAPAPNPPPPPPPPPVLSTRFDVEPCLVQIVRPGQTVAILYVPDTLKLDFSLPSTFPNGRNLPDPVIDYTLAMLFVDLTRHPITVLHSRPVGPPANDRAFLAAFPWLASPNGNPPLTAGGSPPYDIRTDAASAYTRVDRMGMPAVATALIGSSQKNPYNDDSPPQDAAFKYVPEIKAQLTNLTNALADDFDRLGISKCARPI